MMGSKMVRSESFLFVCNIAALATAWGLFDATAVPTSIGT